MFYNETIKKKTWEVWKMANVNGQRILARIHELGKVGIGADGRRTRLAASDTNKQGRDLVVSWMKEAGLKVVVDYIGNIFGIWETPENKDEKPFMVGSHIDTVINAGQYDGCMGVISGIELILTMKENHITTKRPIVVGVFTNEEGVRYAPDMMGSLVYAGGYPLEKALASVGTDGTILGEELKRIGYAGTVEPGFIQPSAFLEYHIEQGPIMDAEGYDIGAVDNLQGIHWYKVKIEGNANHAGTTPIKMRHDAGLAAAKANVFCRELAEKAGGLATMGTISFKPDAVNVIPSEADFTMDLRNPNKEKLDYMEAEFIKYIESLEQTDGVKVSHQRMTDFDPVPFDEDICKLTEKAAAARGLKCRRMVSGAGQDAQMLARICPTAMIFAPSVNGISHNPKEFTKDEAVVSGANVFLDVVLEMANK